MTREILIGGALVVVFALGLMAGGTVTARKLAPLAHVGAQCIEDVEKINRELAELNRELDYFSDGETEVDSRLRGNDGGSGSVDRAKKGGQYE